MKSNIELLMRQLQSSRTFGPQIPYVIENVVLYLSSLAPAQRGNALAVRHPTIALERSIVLPYSQSASCLNESEACNIRRRLATPALLNKTFCPCTLRCTLPCQEERSSPCSVWSFANSCHSAKLPRICRDPDEHKAAQYPHEA